MEEALFDFCNELAGIILKRLHERRPGGVREEICGALESSGNFPREQAYSLFALALELIRAKAKGGYRRDQRELSRLIGKALAAGNPESLN